MSMQPKFALMSDGSCDFSLEEAEQKKVTLVPFYVSFDDTTYRREGYEVGVREFYEEMVSHPGVYPKSSMPSVDDYLQAFRPFAEAGTPVLCVCITSKFSGSFNCASAAAELLREEFPRCELLVLNSRVNTVLQGEVVREAARLRDVSEIMMDSYDDPDLVHTLLQKATGFLIAFAQVGFGELVVMYVLGMPLLFALRKTGFPAKLRKSASAAR